MGWFDDQIKERKHKDQEIFTESLEDVLGAVIGRKYNHDRERETYTSDAIDAVLKFYHIKKKEVSRKGDDLDSQLENYMRPYGIMRRVVELDGGWYKEAVGPIIVRRSDNEHAVALLPFGTGYRFFDEEKGKMVRVNSDNQDIFERYAYVFYRPFPLRELHFSDIVKYIFQCVQISDYANVIIAAAIVALVGMVTPALTKVIFGRVVTEKSISMLMSIAIALMAASVGAMLFNVVKNLLNERISVKIKVSVSAATMMRILSLPASFFKNYSAGELSAYEMQMEELCSVLTSTVLMSGLTSFFSIVYVFQISQYASYLVIPAISILTLTLLITVVSTAMQVRNLNMQMRMNSKENGVSYEMITGVQKIKLAGAEKRAFAKWADIYSKAAVWTYNPPFLLKINTAIVTAITSIGTIVIYYCAIKSGVSVADYYAFDAAYSLVSVAFVSLSGITVSIAQIKSSLELIKPILDAKPEISEEREVVADISGAVDISNISFRYEENEPNVIENLSLRIKSGEYVAIVGRTGCGKSTLVRLLLGFESPQKGAIYYDGRDIQSLDLKSLRKKLGVVIQNGKLFSDDLFHNITITDPALSLNDAWEAAELAGIADEIRNMPMGMNTVLSEAGGGISGGQKQRIMIARAVAPKPKILIFDEATSALDNITQKKISEALDGLKCTRIVIAHRLSTIRNCDRIIVLDGGHITEEGTYEELIARDGYFAELVKRQRIDIDSE